MTFWKIAEIVLEVLASILFLLAVADVRKYIKKLLLILLPFTIFLILFNLLFAYLKLDDVLGLWFVLTIFLPELAMLIILIVLSKQKINILGLITSNLNSWLSFYMIYTLKNAFGHFVSNPIVLTVLLFLLLTPIFFLYLRYIYVRLLKVVEEYMPNKVWLLTLYTIAVIGEIIVYAILLNLTKQKVLRFSIFNVAILSVYFVSIFGFSVFLNEYKQKTVQLINETSTSKQIDMIIEQVETQKANEKKLRILKHDMRHILNSVLGLIKEERYKEAAEIIQSYTKQIDDTTFKEYCKDPVINAIIGYYDNKCHDLKIPFSIKINNFEDSINIPLDDVSLMISNILENALNATAKVNEPFINFKFVNNQGRIILQCTNSFNGNITLDQNNLPTSAKKNHGTGSKSIQYYAKKNNLFVDYYIKDNTFQISIVFNE